jgi:hypothetical protein
MVKTFDNEWIARALEDHSTFFTKRMFGGLAIYLHGRQMMVLVEPTKTGRWTWHGVLICTDHVHHASLIAAFPALAPHQALKKWLFIDSRHPRFERTMERLVSTIRRDDERIGVQPRPRSKREPTKTRVAR